MTGVALDNDILIKGSCYLLLQHLIDVIPSSPSEVRILGAARFLVPARILRQSLKKDHQEAIDEFNSLVGQAEIIEPTEEETQLAAKLEHIGQQNNLPLDAGESQLLAIVVKRALFKFATGDKRAVKAIEAIFTLEDGIAYVKGSIFCLEQLVEKLFSILSSDKIRDKICSEPDVDKSLSICFCCTRVSADEVSCKDGLSSYINSLRREASTVLSS